MKGSIRLSLSEVDIERWKKLETLLILSGSSIQAEVSKMLEDQMKAREGDAFFRRVGDDLVDTSEFLARVEKEFGVKLSRTQMFLFRESWTQGVEYWSRLVMERSVFRYSWERCRGTVEKFVERNK